MFFETKNMNAFYGASHVLKDISINVNKGEIVALLGETEWGKVLL